LQAATPTQAATAAGPLDPLDVDSGRIVVRNGDGSIALLDAAGTPLRALPFPPGGALGAELAGSDLAVLLHGALNDYDAGTGALRHSWPLPDVPSAGFCGRLYCPTAALRLEGAARGLVTYVLDGQVHL